MVIVVVAATMVGLFAWMRAEVDDNCRRDTRASVGVHSPGKQRRLETAGPARKEFPASASRTMAQLGLQAS